MTKIDIISGFLGAGKTTLIKRLLATHLHDEKVILIENEFGEIGIDAGFLKETKVEIKELNQGCICCSLQGDFATALTEIKTKYNPTRIIIEPSGVGKLSDIVKAVVDANLSDVKLNALVCVCDANKAKMYLKNFGEFYIDQVAHAKTIFLSRADVATEAKMQECLEIVREIKRRGHKIFLDLKLHDIPNTVKKSMAVLSKLDVDMTNLHAAGTIDMMKAALEGLTREDGTRPILIAVTQLTSTSEERMQNELLINASINDTIVKYAQNAKEAGLDGVVCSPLEAGMVKNACTKDFITVTPGVRFADGEVGDQVRVTTPEKAKEIGSDYIVVGRPITQAEDPVAAYRRCCAEFIG